jgi:hypothetical protein
MGTDMSVDYFVACKKCKTVRSLDVFYASDIYPVENRKDAIEFAGRMEKDSFKAGLLVSFMGKHKGHECVLFHENSDSYDEMDPHSASNDYKVDKDYWKDV